MSMTWEQKMAAMQAISYETHLRMREPGNWYCSTPGVEIGGDGLLRGLTEASATPHEAVEAHWRQLTNLPLGRYLALHAMDKERRRHVRWNGYMWSDLP